MILGAVLVIPFAAGSIFFLLGESTIISWTFVGLVFVPFLLVTLIGLRLYLKKQVPEKRECTDKWIPLDFKKIKSRTRRYRQDTCLSRVVLSHASRQAWSRLIFNVRQKMSLLTRSSPKTSPRRFLATFWILPWAYCFIFLVVTLLIRNIRSSFISRLEFLTRDSVLLSIIISILIIWILSRILIVQKMEGAISYKIFSIACTAIVEVMIGFFIFIVWVIGMIGGPINHGWRRSRSSHQSQRP